ncbi:MAG: hypothetical protein ACLPJH_20155 [Myxococcaceae bacterium]
MRRRLWAGLGLLCACGGVYVDGSLPTTTPSITSFTAVPDALEAGGGTSVLSWTVLYADSLGLSPAGGDVTGATSKEVRLTATTTYVLTAFNSLGDSTSSVTVTVGP